MPPTPGDSRAAANAATVLRTVLAHGPVARSGISALSGLSQAAVSRQTTGLLRSGLLRELPHPSGGTGEAAGTAGPGTAGRPRIPLDLHTGAVGGPLAAGLHIGVPASNFSLVDLRGQVVARRTLPHTAGPPTPARLATELRRFLHDHGHATHARTTHDHTAPTEPPTPAARTAHRPLLGIGAALGGWIRPAEGVVVRHEALGWHDKPLAAELSAALGLPVHLDNHARAVARAEMLFGHPSARRSIVHLFIGNVVDAAFGIEGTVHQGPGSAAGDVAHLPVPGSAARCACGRTGCLQATASDTALGAEAVRLGIVPEPAIGLIVDAAATGDPRADRLLRERARAVGRAAALLLDVFNPAVLLVSELSSILHEGYLDEIREAATAQSHVCDDPARIIGPYAGPAVLTQASATVLLGPLFQDPAAAPAPALAPATAPSGPPDIAPHTPTRR
ncbi:ROK family transcriptional regulator [Streptomyces sp. H27-H5]|uniref:ROK family transcriptional regulator n=1 Tax=Streptomyces sp. H27-H5 TaxID=2996460 RepID=UPI00226DB3A0|nr:ROK family transcriptional regulator [Streptomyces sp. H27-H5]MCY0961763.1 ROK family transcriptional regulator [Streptomyces sp. H27-H5]